VLCLRYNYILLNVKILESFKLLMLGRALILIREVGIMGFLKFLKSFFQPPKDRNLIPIYLSDKKCNEKIKVLVRKTYDIHSLYEEEGEAAYRLNKVVICNKCYNKINLSIDFDRNYNIIKKTIEGGNFITEEEYNKEEIGSD